MNTIANAGAGARLDAGQFSALLKQPDRISAQDVLHFRGEVFGDNVVSAFEADAIFALDTAIPQKCPEWTQFFVESLTDYIVNQAEPAGYVSVENARWLIERVSHDGHLDSASELELLVKVLDRAKSSPDLLVRYTLNEIARCVIDGEGPLARGGHLTRGVIGAAEVELIRRVLYAFGGEAGMSISRVEAEILFDLNDRTVQAQNHPNWQDLFVKCLANYLMAAATYRAPSRIEALRREEWLEDDKTSLSNIGTNLMGALVGFRDLFSGAFLEEFEDAHEQLERVWRERNEQMEIATTEAERISDDECDWLIDRISKDGAVHENEKALLSFLKRESPDIHPKLNPWLERAA